MVHVLWMEGWREIANNGRMADSKWKEGKMREG